jgi:hypothetical protein
MSKSVVAIRRKDSDLEALIPITSDSSLYRLAPSSQRFQTAMSKAKKALEARKLPSRASNEARESATSIQKAFEKQISIDPAAAATITKLRQHRFSDLSPTVQKLELTTGEKTVLKYRPSTSSFLTNTLTEHISVIAAPYDWDWQRGNGQEYLHNRDGNIAVQGKSGAFPGGSGDRVEAGAGIGMVITSDKEAVVEVRPLIKYHWEYTVGAYGAFSGGSARGGVDAAVFLNGSLVQPIRYKELFSDSRGTFGEDKDSSDGIVWVDDVALSFTMDAGQDFAIPYGVWVDCDHSSGIGSAGGGGLVQAVVQFVVVHRWISG